MINYRSKNRAVVAPLAVPANDHTMGASLLRYLDLKVHPLICADHCTRITVVPSYDRSTGVSRKEKPGKLFNYIRPTAVRTSASDVELRCFPGMDYLFHFGSIVASYARNSGRTVATECMLPSDSECNAAIRNTGVRELPFCRTAILGYVEGLDQLSPDVTWEGSGDIRWKRFSRTIPECLLVGCRHTFWGEIAGRLVECLAERGCRLVVYSGKLGSLDADDKPNQTLATATESILPDGRSVQWDSLFADVSNSCIRKGLHVTVPSVLQETHAWRQNLVRGERFVDPEIGHMAEASLRTGVHFSILHIVSDNLGRAYPYDLSNERALQVIDDRKALCRELCGILEDRLRHT